MARTICDQEHDGKETEAHRAARKAPSKGEIKKAGTARRGLIS